jgi:hypothetical protein
LKAVIISLLLFLCFIITSLSFSQQIKDKPKQYSEIVMPFYDDLNYPYGSDQVREGLIRAFYRRDYK